MSWFGGIASVVGKLWWSWWCHATLSRHGDNSAMDDATDKPTTQGRYHDTRNTLTTVWQRLAMAWESGGGDEVAMGCLPPATKSNQGARSQGRKDQQEGTVTEAPWSVRSWLAGDVVVVLVVGLVDF